MSGLWAKIALPSKGLLYFRRALAVLCIVDAVLRIPSAWFLLSDLGVLPRSLYFRFFEHSYSWSLNLVSGRPEYAILLLLLIVTLSVLQIMGRSRMWMRALLWALVLSVQNRNPALLDSSDDLLKLLLFWDIFLPEEQESPVKFVTPATLGLQVQLTLTLVFTALQHSSSEFALATQWVQSSWPSSIPWFYRGEAVVFLLLTVAVWWSSARLPLLALAVPVLIFRGVAFHPIFPLTLAVGLVSLFSLDSKSERLENRCWSDGGRLRSQALAAVAFVSLVSIGLNTVGGERFRGPFVAVGQALGLLQSWDKVYPVASERLVEMVARKPGGGPVFWTLTNTDGRRLRLLADRMGQNLLWTIRLPDALVHRYGLQGTPVVYLRTERIHPDFRLGLAEIQLLSTTPVRGTTRGRP